ncbi:MAG: DEAD/DEAH box helicase [Acidobacteria bacterium]|nr:DEAD/DEAH box helicase [Acidobacteriota bacterium]
MMSPRDVRKDRRGRSPLATLEKGRLLGLLPKNQAESAFRLYQSHQVDRIVWTGNGIEGTLRQPACTVHIAPSGRHDELSWNCTRCPASAPCPHAVAVLFRWLDIRATMLRMGPNTVWRARARQPFLSLAGDAEDRLNLSHATGEDLRAALKLQLSLHRPPTASARLVDGQVEIQIKLPSGRCRTVVLAASILPHALPILRSLDGLKLEGELAGLELSEARLHPTLIARLDGLAIQLDPGYMMPDGSFAPLEDVQNMSFGRWTRAGHLLCRRLDPDTFLVPFFRKGAHLLTGHDAVNFLTLDHPTLATKPWYRPRGALAQFTRIATPSLSRLEVHAPADSNVVTLRPVFEAGDVQLSWEETLTLLETDLLRHGDLLLRAPDLGPLERLGFQLTPGGRTEGLRGDRLALLRLLAEADVPISGDDAAVASLTSALRPGRDLEPLDPPRMLGRLRPYQRLGLAWLWQRYTVGVGALLADDMGLGKTHQVMGLLCLVRETTPNATALIVCPRGVMEHWEDLLTRFVPHLPVSIYHGPERSLDRIPQGTAIVLTTYEIMIRSVEELASRDWDIAIFDEAQRMKNPRTKASRAARRILASYRVALTGTENRPAELWSIVDLLVPGYLGSERSFRSSFKGVNSDVLHRVKRRVGMITLRRVKDQVLTDLPPKLEDIRHCRLLPEQEALYRQIHDRQVKPVAEKILDPGAEIPYVHIFAVLTRLKQVCDHPGLVDKALASRLGSGKLTVLDELLDEALGSGQLAVVFTQYVTMIEILDRHLARRRIPHLKLTGGTRDRGLVIRRFNSMQHERVLLASLLAGGIGIDLTGASVVIHYDRWWNPAKENQATDRVHRIGQHRFVQVYKLVTRGTIEERIDRIIRSKLELMNTVVAPTQNVIAGLSRTELAELLKLPDSVAS